MCPAKSLETKLSRTEDLESCACKMASNRDDSVVENALECKLSASCGHQYPRDSGPQASGTWSNGRRIFPNCGSLSQFLA